MTITLTREEAQQVLDALEEFPYSEDIKDVLRARLAEPEKEQLSAADQYAHRLALMLECMMLSPDNTYNTASELLSWYYEAVRKEHEAAGEPYVSGFGKD
jgi:hypothetical protein